METTPQHEATVARQAWSAAPGRVTHREQGKLWPALAVTAGVNLVALGLSWLAKGIRRPTARALQVGGPLLTVSSWFYVLFLRRWHLRWGATDEEVRRSIPGDELVPHPHLDTTRAITIDATPEALWPWLVQMGYRRGGWYSYDWLDNFGSPSASRIHPELQNLKVGDSLAPFEGAFTVAALEPQRSLVLVSRNKQGRITASWSFFIEPMGAGRSRFIERIRGVYEFSSLGGLFWFLTLEPTDFIMMRKQMLNLKRRVEQAAAVGALDAAL